MTYTEIIQKLKDSGITLEGFAHEDLDIAYAFSEKALKAQETKDEWLKNNPSNEAGVYKSEPWIKWNEKYNSFPSKYSVAQKEWFEANNIPEWEEVEQHGGEGEGSNWYSVKYFPKDNVYIKVQGYYESYNGTDFYGGWDDCCSQVLPTEKVITVYETIK